jgi:peptidoglycan/xylan/chitin deacetylase (PgdA/CDA1 family)
VWSKPAYKISDILTDAPPNAIALTIDDGPHPVWTPKIIDLLDKYDVQATFNLIGEQIAPNAKLIQMMVEAGHEVANHTWTHPLEIASLERDRVDREIGRTIKEITAVAGKPPTLFRSPGGAWSKTVFASAAHFGLIPVDWDVDPRDWSRPGVPHIVQQLLSGRAGDILLCHDGGGDRDETYQALKIVLPRLKSRGLDFITL